MSKKPSKVKMGLDSGIFMSVDLFYLRKIFDLRKIFAVPKNFLKSKIYCIINCLFTHLRLLSV